MKDLFKVISESLLVDRLNGATYEKVTNAFLANYMAALLLLKLQDLKGLMLINDHSHSKLTKLSPQMSDLNFWGLVMFYPTNPEVKARVLASEVDRLSVEAKQVQHTRVQFMMHVPLTSPGEVKWPEVIACLALLKQRYHIHSSYFRYMLDTLLRWDTVSENLRKKAISNSFMYLMQADPHSKLLARMRALSTTLLVKGAGSVASSIVSFKKIVEDGEAVSTGSIASSPSGANAIVRPPSMPGASCDQATQSLYKLDKLSSHQVTKKGKYIFKDNKLIKKRKKKFEPRKFKAPEILKKSKAEKDDV